MKQRVGFARALVVEPEVLFMDEPFSALDVLTAENLRSELLELWAKKTMPTKAVFLVTHNIEEAVLLADRIVVLGRNPGHIRTDFRVQLPQPRDRKSEAFTQLVDYIYKVLTRPDAAPAGGAGHRPAPAGDQRADALPDAAACAARRHCRLAGIAARQGRPRRHLSPGRRPGLRDRRSAAHCGRRATARLPEDRRGRRRHHARAGRSLPTPRFFARRSCSATLRWKMCCCCGRFAARSKPRATTPCPKSFFLDMLDEQFSEEESQRQMETAVTWGRYAELFDFDAARRRFVLPDALEEAGCRSEEARSEAQRILSRAPSSPCAPGPFFIDLGRGLCALAVFFAVVSTGVYWFRKPIPVVPISNSIGALPVYAFYSIVRMAIAYCLSLAFAITYGYIAAYNPRIEPWMVAVLDILQSIPVLSFLPPVVLAMVSLIPGHQLGIEMGVILLIFTGQVWNLAFSFYSSLKTIPREMRGGVAHLSLLRLAALLAA